MVSRMAARTHEAVLSVAGLSVSASPLPSRVRQRLFDCRIEVDSHPFRGELATVLTADDFIGCAGALETLNQAGKTILGGGRTAELSLLVEKQTGGAPGSLAVECSLCPSGDDPWPRLSFLLFDVPGSVLATAAQRLRHLTQLEPWPEP